MNHQKLSNILSIVMIGCTVAVVASTVMLLKQPERLEKTGVSAPVQIADPAVEEIYQCVEDEIRSVKNWHDPKLSRQSVFSCVTREQLQTSNWVCIKDRLDEKKVEYAIDFNARCPLEKD